MEQLSGDSIEVTRINGSTQRGGWECEFDSLSDTDIVEVNQRVALLWKGAFGGDYGPLRTAFDGYVLPSQIDFDLVASRAKFIASTCYGFLSRGWLQGLGLADTGADARVQYHQWDSVTGGGVRMDLGRIIQHILGYYDDIGVPPATNPDWVAHTNLVHHPVQSPHGIITLDNVETTPFDAAAHPDGTMRVDIINIRETNNLWSRLQDIARMEFFNLYFDKSNTLHYEKHPMFQSVVPAPVMEFDENFAAAPPVLTPRASEQYKQVRLRALTDEGDVLLSEYPASPTFVYGRVDPPISRLRCNSQDMLDEWARIIYLYKNRDYAIKWTAPGLCGLLFEMLDRVEITYAGTDANGVHIDWDKKKFWIQDITATPIPGTFSGTSEFLLEAESA